jgi:hypothetical protein
MDALRPCLRADKLADRADFARWSRFAGFALLARVALLATLTGCARRPRRALKAGRAIYPRSSRFPHLSALALRPLWALRAILQFGEPGGDAQVVFRAGRAQVGDLGTHVRQQSGDLMFQVPFDPGSD